jgi:cell division control protein 6
VNSIEELFKGVQIFKDESKLFPEYVPSSLPHREEQIKSLATYLGGLLIPSNYAFYRVICYGPTGTGKTAVNKYFGKLIQQEAKNKGINLYYVHVNCHIERTYFMIVKKIVESLFPQIPKRGFSPQQMLEELLKYLEEEDIKLLLCLDESDYLIRTDPDILYNLTRLAEKELGKNRISLILILRDITLLYNLEESTLSTLQKNTIKFDPYTSAQLFTILKERSEEAFIPGVVNDEIIQMISRIVGADNNGKGDARFALEILWKAGKIAINSGDKQLIPEHVRKALSEVYPYLNLEMINSLEKQEKILLKALALALKELKQSQINVGRLNKYYKLVCEEYSEKPLKYTQLWSYLQRLKNKNLINIKVSNLKRGRSSLISIDIPAEVIIKNIKIE